MTHTSGTPKSAPYLMAVIVIACAVAALSWTPLAAQEPEPAPEPTVEGQFAAAAQAVADSITAAQGGQTGVDAAMATAAAAEADWQAAQQGVADAVTMRDGSHGTVLAGINALEDALDALRMAYTPEG